jgi:hypothetical protein
MLSRHEGERKSTTEKLVCTSSDGVVAAAVMFFRLASAGHRAASQGTAQEIGVGTPHQK